MECVLSAKQAKVLAFIKSEIEKWGRPPTYRDIALGCGYDAVGTVQDHVRALIKKGFLEKDAGVARGLKLVHRNSRSSLPAGSLEQLPLSDHPKWMDIPILGLVPAGTPLEMTEHFQGTLTVPNQWRGPLFALKVKGESMKDAGILDGDFVVVKKQNDAENGEIVVALVEGEATVKYLEKKQGRTRLLPANPDFLPIEWGEPSTLHSIQGKVVSVQRFYRS